MGLSPEPEPRTADPNGNGHTKRIKLRDAALSTVRNASLSHLLSEFCSGNITRIQHFCHCHCQHRSEAKKLRLSVFFGSTFFYLPLSFGVFACAHFGSFVRSFREFPAAHVGRKKLPSAPPTQSFLKKHSSCDALGRSHSLRQRRSTALVRRRSAAHCTRSRSRQPEKNGFLSRKRFGQ